VSGGGNDQNGGDCGAIYVQDRYNGGGTSGNIHFTNNYIRDVNISSNGAGDFGGSGAYGIYQDDGASNITSSGNVILGKKSACWMVSGGINDHMTGNICDMDNAGVLHIVNYNNSGLVSLGMTGNTFQNNIVVLGNSSAGSGYVGYAGPPNPMSVGNNFYHNYIGASVTATGSGGAGGDSSRVTGDPQISCYVATIAGGSPVFQASPSGINFPGITGGWGPPGFVMPQTGGTAPSWPHGC
jgi:hypothetical protein